MLRWGSSSSVTANSSVFEEDSSSGAMNINKQLQQQQQDETSSSSPESQEPSGALLVDDDESDEEEEDIDDYEDEIPRKKARGDKRKRTQDEDASGSDHVEPDEDEDEADSEDMHPNWQPQNVQSTTEFTHIIADYGKKRESGCKKAEYSDITVDDHGNRWRLIIYVNGNGRASNHHLSLFLQVADADDLPFGWKKSVSYVLTLEHPNGSTYSYAKRNPDKTFKLCPKAIDWGWSQFITSDRIQQEGFVSDDSLTVRASVTVKSSSVSIDEEDSELYLKCAVEEGDADAVELCLENGASVNCQFKDDLYTPLHTACSSGSSTGSMEVLQILLERGADCNACNKWRETPLLIAANNGHRLGVAALLKHGADPSLCSEAGWSALTFAAHKGYDDIVALLLHAGAPVNSRVSEDLSTPLHKACAGSKPGHLASVKLLLEAAADVHALNKWRETPLLTAANHGQSGAVEVLLSHGADPCKCTDTGWSPLSIAAYKGHDDVVRLLLEEGAPTEEDDPTLSALLQAATKGLPDTVELLLRHGADHTVTTKKGDTALSILVEQNLIDAAVEMVTHYNASIPRCSRDRKKVQRARLLINLRMKQLEREGRSSLEEDDSENDGEGETTLAQHVANGQTPASRPQSNKKKKGKSKTKMSAEEKAKAAEEALLQELEKEEEEARKEEEEASKKKAKNQKKKERARQLKLKEEQERREKEAAELKEQERVRKEKEEKERQELAKILEEAKEREMKEFQKKKAQDKRLRQKHREEKPRESPSSPKRPPNALVENKSKPVKTKKASFPQALQKVAPSVAEKPYAHLGADKPVESNRRWETKAKLHALAPIVKETTAGTLNGNRRPILLDTDPDSKVARLPTHSPNGTIQMLQAKNEEASPSEMALEESLIGHKVKPRQKDNSVEHPSLVTFRRDKVVELLRRAVVVQDVLDLYSVKKIIFRWITRAHHDNDDFADPIIPSWTDANKAAAFFQRQFISESRRSGSEQAMNMEALKNAGSSLSKLCQGLALEVLKFSNESIGLPEFGFTDSGLGLIYQPQVDSAETHVISWGNKSRVSLSGNAMEHLRKRYNGPGNKMLAVFFATCMYRETLDLILSDTGLDLQLSAGTKSRLASELEVSIELNSDPLSTAIENKYFGTFEEIDFYFGGDKPFTKDDSLLLQESGGSCAVLLPLETTVASKYASHMIDLVLEANTRHVPLSFAVFVPILSVQDPDRPISRDLLRQLDARFGTIDYIAEIVPASTHHFWSSTGTFQKANGDTLFFILQSDQGKQRFRLRDVAIANIVESMGINAYEASHSPPSSLLPEPFQSNYSSLDPPPVASPYFLTPESSFHANMFTDGGGATAFGITAADDQSPSIPFDLGRVPSGPPRRGRLFDLVDNDVEEDNAVDLVAGMLDKLDVGLFHNGGTSTATDIDIEAISLMGINSASQPTSSFERSSGNPFG